jgi:hypothetical protein
MITPTKAKLGSSERIYGLSEDFPKPKTNPRYYHKGHTSKEK